MRKRKNESVVDVVIYGKYLTISVNGTIKKGDYLVYSPGATGVATSMYNRSHPLPALSGILTASTNPNIYNLYAKMLPCLGMAMESYNSTSLGYIKVSLGKC